MLHRAVPGDIKRTLHGMHQYQVPWAAQIDDWGAAPDCCSNRLRSTPLHTSAVALLLPRSMSSSCTRKPHVRQGRLKATCVTG
jgi:hypothetical protein